MPTAALKPIKERPLIEALDELHREFAVRQRCYHRWIDDGKVSRTDAQDRLDRLASAIAILAGLDASATVTSTGDKTAEVPHGYSTAAE
jgi:hypothetical protein